MSVIAVLLFVAVTSYGNNLGKAPIQFNKDKICNKSKTMERDTIKPVSYTHLTLPTIA